MGLNFRKSIKLLDGVKLNVGKKSVGVSIGTKGAHYSINSSGKQTATVGIPGTGLSYSKTLGKSKKAKSKKAILGFVAVAAIVLVIVGVKLYQKKASGESLNSSSGLLSNILPAEKTTAITDDSTVYVTPSGKKYHIDKNCAGKNGSGIKKSEAVEKGYSPCSKCIG